MGRAGTVRRGETSIKLDSLSRDMAPAGMPLEDGARVAVIGGGPAGAMFAHFLLDLGARSGRAFQVDIFDAKDFHSSGPRGCNHCGGIISESLVQHLATEGIVLPDDVVQRGIDSYVLHVDSGSVGIDTPLQEKRIAATYRGGGPRGSGPGAWGSFDAFLLDMAAGNGATVIHERVDSVDFAGERPTVTTREGTTGTYDLVVGATGVNAAPKNLFHQVHLEFKPARTSRTFISEIHLGGEQIRALLGDAMHVFLLDIPRLQFAAIIPKGEFATLVLLGDAIDKDLLARFLDAPEVKKCFPPGVDIPNCFDCQCYPQITVQSAVRPYADRLVLVGDVAATKLYKNGIGAAYLAAKAAAGAAAFGGVSARSFERYYRPVCRRIERDNGLGRLIFAVTGVVKKLGWVKRGFLRLILREQAWPGDQRRLSMVMWDTFTGSAAYRDILGRMLNPALLFNLSREIVMGFFRRSTPDAASRAGPDTGVLGRVYADGEAIVSQGQTGNCMYVVQQGSVQVLRETDGQEVPLAMVHEGGFFGEMALFGEDERTATVRARGEATVLTVDQHTLLRQITENPSLAFHLIQEMAARLRQLNSKHARVLQHDRRNWENRPAEKPVA